MLPFYVWAILVAEQPSSVEWHIATQSRSTWARPFNKSRKNISKRSMLVTIWKLNLFTEGQQHKHFGCWYVKSFPHVSLKCTPFQHCFVPSVQKTALKSAISGVIVKTDLH
jgi:hypothetical protein